MAADLYIRWSKANPKDDATGTQQRPLNPCWPPNAFWTNASIYLLYPPIIRIRPSATGWRTRPVSTRRC